MREVPRDAIGAVRRLLRTFPAVLVVGPRQCGKTTFVRSLFPDWTYLDLERPSDLGVLEADLRGLLRRSPAAALNGMQIRPSDAIFTDGFESGDTSGCSGTVPAIR